MELSPTVYQMLPPSVMMIMNEQMFHGADYSIFLNFFRHKFSREKVFIMNTLTGASINVYSYNTVRFYSKCNERITFFSLFLTPSIMLMRKIEWARVVLLIGC